MPETRTYGLPDIELTSREGHSVNPANFAGHDLVVLFCPSDSKSAAQELVEYNGLADGLAYNDAYMVAVCNREAGLPASRIALATETDQAWDAFNGSSGKLKRPYPRDGAVFLFGRGGCLRQAWEGSGHAREVMRALGERM